MRARLGLRIAAPIVLAAACGTPIGVHRMDPTAVHRDLTANELTVGEPSVPSRIVLQRAGLTERYDKDPAGALGVLHAAVGKNPSDAELLFALAELSFHHAEHGGGPPYHLAAAVYAWAFLFPDRQPGPLDPFDPRVRVACDLYNRGIARGFAARDGLHVDLAGGARPLPFGTLDVAFDADQLRWGDRRLVTLTDASQLEVTGLRNRYRAPGIGAPLNATTAPLDESAGYTGIVFPRVKLPITALLRLADVRAGLAAGRLEGRLEVLSADDPGHVEIAGRRVPLEREPTSALADSLSTPIIWQLETAGFLRADFIARMHGHALGGIEPYRPGRIPVVFVHGTDSSPGRWAQMVNDLQNDPSIQSRFQLWAFAYDSGNPIAYSAMLLRRALRDAVARLDPHDTDPCLRRMVLVGHSQGGLLVKMTVIDSGDRLWRKVSDRSLDDMPLDDKTKALLREGLFVEPLPFIRRVVFIATPQRGSYRATAWVSDLASRLIHRPAVGVALAGQLGSLRKEKAVFSTVKRIPTSIDNMSPGNPFIEALADIPVVPDVPAHSIIGNAHSSPLAKANDGVVAYESAHIEPVESELIVHSEHSMQAKPEVIEEVRRILLVHEAHLAATHDACHLGSAPGEPPL